MTIKEVKDLNNKIQDFFKIDPDDSRKIILALQADREKMAAVLSGDLSCVPDVAAENKILITKNPSWEKISRPEKFSQTDIKISGSEKIYSDDVSRKDSDKIGPEKSADNISEKVRDKFQDFPVKDPADDRKQGRQNPDGVNITELVKQDTLDNVLRDIPPATLPEDFPEKIENTITDFMTRYHVDDMRKASAEEWRAACMYVGRVLIIPSLVTIDRQKLIASGVRVYNPDVLDNLMDLWAFLCGTFKKAPLASDFAAFAGVSHVYLYPDREKRKLLTTSGTDLSKKVQAIQEAGLASGLVDGRKNPTGTIFFLKNWHGWKDQREIVHTGGNMALDSGALPVLALPEGEK